MGREIESRAQARNARAEQLRQQLLREVEESDRRLEERYGGSASLRGGRSFACLPRAFVPPARGARVMAEAPTG